MGGGRPGRAVRRYALHRLAQAVPVLIGVTIVAWALASLAPGDAARNYARQFSGSGRATPEEIEQARHDLRLDGNPVEQYLAWASRVLRGDLGRSFSTGRPVRDELSRRLPATIELALAGLALTLVIGVGLGIAAARWQGRGGDVVVRVLAVGGGAIPAFWMSLVLIWLFAARWHLLPSGGRDGALSSGLILPAAALALVYVGETVRLTRSSVAQAMGQEYVRAARARGLTERRVVAAHGLRNALLPVVTQLGLLLGELLAGAAVVEVVFAWPGLGKLAVDAIATKDYPVIQGVVLLSAVIYLAVGLILDLLYARLDPRVAVGRPSPAATPAALVGQR